MNLTVRIIEAPALLGGKAMALCTEDGEVLPMQTRCVMDADMNGGTITATFIIDGDRIKLV